IISMPAINEFPEDNDYLDNLNYSLNEIDTMYQRLTRRKDFETVITNDNKKLFYKYYNSLNLQAPVLLLKNQDEDKITKYNRFAKHHLNNMKMLFIDTSATDISIAISNVRDFQTIGDYYRDSLKNYSKSNEYYETSKE